MTKTFSLITAAALFFALQAIAQEAPQATPTPAPVVTGAPTPTPAPAVSVTPTPAPEETQPVDNGCHILVKSPLIKMMVELSPQGQDGFRSISKTSTELRVSEKGVLKWNTDYTSIPEGKLFRVRTLDGITNFVLPLHLNSSIEALLTDLESKKEVPAHGDVSLLLYVHHIETVESPTIPAYIGLADAELVGEADENWVPQTMQFQIAVEASCITQSEGNVGVMEGLGLSSSSKAGKKFPPIPEKKKSKLPKDFVHLK